MARVRFPQLTISKISKTSKRCWIPKVFFVVVEHNIHNIPSRNINEKFCWDDFFVLDKERTFLQKYFFFSLIKWALFCRIMFWPTLPPGLLYKRKEKRSPYILFTLTRKPWDKVFSPWLWCTFSKWFPGAHQIRIIKCVR